MIVISTIVFLIGAALTNIWVMGAFTGGAAGVGAGILIGVLGLLITRWEPTPRSLHYTPNRWLVLLITVIVSLRVLYGLYRSALVAQSGMAGASVALAFGIPESFAVGGTVIGYYLAYNAGLRCGLRLAACGLRLEACGLRLGLKRYDRDVGVMQ
jgi:hypothetical protein